MTYLFLASIGPIQSFIASSRRTRDLWFGSTLLSEISKTVARTIAENKNNTLIFPAPFDMRRLEPNTNLKVPNKIVARITDDPKTLGEKVEQEIEANIKTLYERLFKALQSREFDQEVARKQIEDLVEYTWVALKEDDNLNVANENYHETRKQLEGLLAARKNTRNYSKITWQSEKPKSSIDGKLESVIPEALYAGNRGSPEVQAQSALDLFDKFHAGKSERLSGVDLLKRMGEFSDDRTKQQGSNAFFSTSHIASLPYLQRLTLLSASSHTIQRALRTAWGEYTRSLPAPLAYERISAGNKKHLVIHDYDGALLYGERLAEAADSPGKLLLATSALHNFFNTVNEYVNEASLSPSPYYAIVVADGDGMGKIIDYESASERGPERHQEISRALDRFDDRIRKLVEGEDDDYCQGGLIYSGGDDVLAFVPLHNLLTCVQGLSAAFKDCLKDFKNKKGNAPTLSVGVAIVHHLFPLTDALEQARGAEKIAKAVAEKNALAIKLYKRSGEEYTISGHWGELDVYLQQLIKHYQAQRIPKGLPYDLRESLLRLTALRDDDHADTLIKIIKADAKRILERKLKVPRRKQDSESAALLRLIAGRIGIELDEQPVPQQKAARQGETPKSDENQSGQSVQEQTNKQHKQDAAQQGETPKSDENQSGQSVQEQTSTRHLKISTFYRLMEIYIHEFIIAKELADALTLAGGRPAPAVEEAHV